MYVKTETPDKDVKLNTGATCQPIATFVDGVFKMHLIANNTVNPGRLFCCLMPRTLTRLGDSVEMWCITPWMPKEIAVYIATLDAL